MKNLSLSLFDRKSADSRPLERIGFIRFLYFVINVNVDCETAVGIGSKRSWGSLMYTPGPRAPVAGSAVTGEANGSSGVHDASLAAVMLSLVILQCMQVSRLVANTVFLSDPWDELPVSATIGSLCRCKEFRRLDPVTATRRLRDVCADWAGSLQNQQLERRYLTILLM